MLFLRLPSETAGMSKTTTTKMEEEGRSVEKIYQDKNTIVEITVHTKPKRVRGGGEGGRAQFKYRRFLADILRWS